MIDWYSKPRPAWWRQDTIAMMRDEHEKPATPGGDMPGTAAVAEVRRYASIEWDDDACCTGVACGCQVRLAEQAPLETGDTPMSQAVGDPTGAARRGATK